MQLWHGGGVCAAQLLSDVSRYFNDTKVGEEEREKGRQLLRKKSVISKQIIFACFVLIRI